MTRLINKLINRLIQEIKKPSESPPKLLKTNNSVALRTTFQALLYCHTQMKKNMSFDFCLIDSEVGEYVSENDHKFAKEIVDNKEQIWLEDFRWYRNKIEVAKAPKSSILCLLFCIEGFLRWHWEVAHKVIQTKRNTENFLDEYITRWVSYSDLIMTMEEEFHFVECAINNIHENKLIEKEKHLNTEFVPKYSLLRMMCRLWGKYVMKRLLPAFIEKIKSVLSSYHEKVLAVAMEYKKIVKGKFGKAALKGKWLIDTVIRDLLLQSVQMVVDVSLNEISINYIESTWVQLGIFYPQVEEVVLKEISRFYDEIQVYVDPTGFYDLSELHIKEIKTVFPKTTQRKMCELMSAKQVEYWEERIKAMYEDFNKYEESKSNEMTKKISENTFRFDNVNNILGKYENERVAMWITNLVMESQSGSYYDIPDLGQDASVSEDDEEFKTNCEFRTVSLPIE